MRKPKLLLRMIWENPSSDQGILERIERDGVSTIGAGLKGIIETLSNLNKIFPLQTIISRLQKTDLIVKNIWLRFHSSDFNECDFIAQGEHNLVYPFIISKCFH